MLEVCCSVVINNCGGPVIFGVWNCRVGCAWWVVGWWVFWLGRFHLIVKVCYRYKEVVVCVVLSFFKWEGVLKLLLSGCCVEKFFEVNLFLGYWMYGLVLGRMWWWVNYLYFYEWPLVGTFWYCSFSVNLHNCFRFWGELCSGFGYDCIYEIIIELLFWSNCSKVALWLGEKFWSFFMGVQWLKTLCQWVTTKIFIKQVGILDILMWLLKVNIMVLLICVLVVIMF